MVVTAFIDCELLDLQLKTTCLHDPVDIKSKVLPEDDIIRTFKTKFRYIKTQGPWSPSEEKKLGMKGDLDYFNLEMKKFAE